MTARQITARQITAPERRCAVCQARTHVWLAEAGTWIPDAPHDGKCPTRVQEQKAAA